MRIAAIYHAINGRFILLLLECRKFYTSRFAITLRTTLTTTEHLEVKNIDHKKQE